VVDAQRGFGNGLALPAGPMREPLARLRGVDAIVVNGGPPPQGLPADVPQFAMTLTGARLRNLVDPDRVEAPAHFQSLRLVAIAGVGNPARFFAQLRAFGLEFEARSFPDHHRFSAAEVRFPGADAILMTEKDAIKCAAFRDARMWALPVAVETSDALAQLVIDRIAAAARPAPGAGHTES
jgi:tetraacyldisaccharide 4'-kinase